MQILIVDDEELARIRLKRLLSAIAGCEVVGEAATGARALAAVQELEPELVFLDVRMPDIDGLAVAKQLTQKDDPPAIIFCTAYDEYAVEAFATLAQGYLVKPVDSEQLAQVIEKTKKITRVQRKATGLAGPDKTDAVRAHIATKSRHRVERIAVDSIFCFIADQKYVTVVHAGGETLIDDTLKDLESEFAGLFLRVHRSTLVRLDKISALQRNVDGSMEVRFHGSDYRPLISRRHLSKVKAALAER